MCCRRCGLQVERHLFRVWAGCNGTESDFISIFVVNLALLTLSASPVLTLMPSIWMFGKLVEKGRIKISCLTPKRGSEICIEWKTRFWFAVRTWICLSGLSFCYLSLLSIFWSRGCTDSLSESHSDSQHSFSLPSVCTHVHACKSCNHIPCIS